MLVVTSNTLGMFNLFLPAPHASFCKRAMVRIWPELTKLKQHPVVASTGMAQYAGMQAGREAFSMCNLSLPKKCNSKEIFIWEENKS